MEATRWCNRRHGRYGKCLHRGEQPAALSDGEFVIPADVVGHLGNGNSDAGADVLYGMMANIRKARATNTKQGTQINPNQLTKQKGMA